LAYCSDYKAENPEESAEGEGDFKFFFLTFCTSTEFGLAKEFYCKFNIQGVYFQVFLCRNEFLRPKKEKSHKTKKGQNFFFSECIDTSSKRSGI
jgi:hypothetical protein